MDNIFYAFFVLFGTRNFRTLLTYIYIHKNSLIAPIIAFEMFLFLF